MYLGKATGGLIELDSFQLPQMKMVQPNELVKLISTYHSSDLWDELPSRKIVYVQPIEQAKQEKWKDEEGIAVFLDQLERLKIQPEQNQKKENKRSSTNFSSNSQPEIKQAHEQSIRVTYPPKSPTPPKIDNKPNLSFNPTTKLNQDLDVP